MHSDEGSTECTVLAATREQLLRRKVGTDIGLPDLDDNYKMAVPVAGSSYSQSELRKKRLGDSKRQGSPAAEGNSLSIPTHFLDELPRRQHSRHVL